LSSANKMSSLVVSPQFSSLGSQCYQPLFFDRELVAPGEDGDAQHGKAPWCEWSV